jgi:O-antigen/teichoic acid export membrane protein
MRFDRLFWWRLPDVLFGLTLGVAAVLVRPDVWALVITSVGAQAASTICSYGVVPWRPHFGFVRHAAWRLLRYGRWVQATRFVTFLCVYGDNAVVGRMLGTAALGFYQLAFRLAEVPTTGVALVAARVALPAMRELRHDPARLRAWYGSALRALLAANAAFALLLLMFSETLVMRLLGPAWAPAVPALRVLAAAMVFRSVIVFGAELFNALGAPQVTLTINLLRLTTMALTIWPLTRRLGIEGAALSVLLAGLVGCVAQLRLGHTALADLGRITGERGTAARLPR